MTSNDKGDHGTALLSHPSGIANSKRTASLPAAAACKTLSQCARTGTGATHSNGHVAQSDLISVDRNSEASVADCFVHARNVTLLNGN